MDIIKFKVMSNAQIYSRYQRQHHLLSGAQRNSIRCMRLFDILFLDLLHFPNLAQEQLLGREGNGCQHHSLTKRDTRNDI